LLIVKEKGNQFASYHFREVFGRLKIAGFRQVFSGGMRANKDIWTRAKCVSRTSAYTVHRRRDMMNRNVTSLSPGRRISLIGNSPAITRVVDLIERSAPANANVLIHGPTGTGKELVARSIHDLSGRMEGPFIPVNCAALPENLIESELFGHVKGAFTGAVADRKGFFEAAQGGTIFLDEIGDLPLTAQVKLLRPLQERSIHRVGENLERPIDCRVVAATNKDLEAACKDGTFREDLYYRLKIVKIYVPPLSERKEDIPLLINHFLTKIPVRMYSPGHPTLRISAEAMDAIMRYSFPGNVRELENAIESAIPLSDGKLIRVEDLPETIRGEVKEDSPVGNPRCMPSSRLLEALKEILPRSIRIVKVEDLARFLSETGGRWFRRKDFEDFLRERGGRDIHKSTYGTAGRYLRAMTMKGVLGHNGGKANKSRFRVLEVYLVED
jgi:transcriptional regulator with GAF, ATPase, and Fis domain